MNLTFGLDIDIVLLSSRQNHGGLDAKPVVGLHLRSLLPLLLVLLSLKGGRQGDNLDESAAAGIIVYSSESYRNQLTYLKVQKSRKNKNFMEE